LKYILEWVLINLSALEAIILGQNFDRGACPSAIVQLSS